MSRARHRSHLLVPLIAGALIAGLLPAMVLAASPDAPDQVLNTNEDTALPITLTGTDADGGDLTFAIDTGPSAGALSALSDPAACDGFTPSSCSVDVTYTPNPNATGPDSFTYTVSDGDTTDPGTISITIDPVNDPPTGTNGSTTALEDASVTIHIADFGFSDPDDSPPNDFLSVIVATAPTAGTLTNDGALVSDNGEVLVTDIVAGKLVYSPAQDGNGDGYDTITFQVRDAGGTDGTGAADLDPSPNILTIDVTSVNDAPDGVDKTVAVIHDGSYAFTTSDFGFTDPHDSPPDTLTAVMIVVPPAAGTLADDGVAVTAGDSIPAADIDASNLVFTPSLGGSGPDYASFTFKVQDDGGTASGGVDLDPTANTIMIDITNRAPSGTDATVTTPEDTARAFGVADFGFSDPDDDPANGLLAVKITTLPSVGTLKNGATVLGAGAFVPLADIAASHLVFTPALNGNGSPYASFTFQVQDNGGTADGGLDLDPTPNTLTIDVTPVDDLPDARNDTTITVPESAGPTSLPVLANDTDPDDTLHIVSTTAAAHGVVAITGGGTGLTYDPAQLYFGTDTFTYTISDGRGHTDTATVLLTVVRDTTKPTVSGLAESFYAQTVATSTTGGHIGWSGSDGGSGIAKFELQVSVNGGAFSSIALATATSTSIDRTQTDEASYRYRVRATDKEGNVSAWLNSPPWKPGRVQDDSTSIVYTGSWVTSADPSTLGGSHRSASASGVSASITRNVRDFAWVATRTATSGSAEVWIDGVLAATIDLHAPTSTYRQLVFSHHFSRLGTHSMEIRPVGDGPIDVDAFLIVREPFLVVGAPAHSTS